MTWHPSTFWTPEKTSELQRLWLLVPHMSFGEIGRALGCTKDSVISKARRIGLKQPTSGDRPITYLDHHKISAMKRQGLSLELMARALNRDPADLAKRMTSRGRLNMAPLPPKAATPKRLPPVKLPSLQALPVQQPAPVARLATGRMPAHFTPHLPADRKPPREMTDIPSIAAPREPANENCRHRCKRPLWGDRQKPTHQYCDAPTRSYADVYCEACKQRLFARHATPRSQEASR